MGSPGFRPFGSRCAVSGLVVARPGELLTATDPSPACCSLRDCVIHPLHPALVRSQECELS